MVNLRKFTKVIVSASLLWVFSAMGASLAYGQFTLVTSALHPASVNPGGTATATIDLGPATGFTNPVALTCAVTSNQASPVSIPACSISPTSEAPPANGPSLTVTTTGTTSSGIYQVVVTGASTGAPTQTSTLFLNVTDLTEDYTLSVLPTTAVPSPLPAGSSATTTVTVTPIGSYTGSVTLACLSVTPVVTGAPICSFSPATVAVTSGVPPTSTLTITTLNTTTTTSQLSYPRMFYSFWLAIPALTLVGAGWSRKHRKKLMGLLSLIAIAAGLIFLPACGSTSTTSVNNATTPVNSYTFTLTGTDKNGATPSNATTDEATVTLSVTAPINN